MKDPDQLLEMDPARDDSALNSARAAAWMAFCKGLAVMGNRDAGEHKHVFESWWLCYGVVDARSTLALASAPEVHWECQQKINALDAEIERLRVNRDHSCTCPHGDASEPFRNHDWACPVRVNKRKRIAPEVAMQRLASALDSGDENELLRDELKEALRMSHPSTSGSYTDDHKRDECVRLTKEFNL